MAEKTLGNTDINGTEKNVPDVVKFGDGDMFHLLCKASSQTEGWMKSTKAMGIIGAGCVVQVTTQQKNADGSYACAEAVTFVPNVRIVEEKDTDGNITGRHLETAGFAEAVEAVIQERLTPVGSDRDTSIDVLKEETTVEINEE